MHARVEKLRIKWAKSEEQREARRAMLTEAVATATLKTEERRKAFQAGVHEVLERNQAKIHEGTFKGPIVPIGFEAEGSGTSSRSEARSSLSGEVAEVVGPFLNLGSEVPEDKSVLREITGKHTTEALTIPEYRSIEDEFIEKAVLEDLKEPYRSKYEEGTQAQESAAGAAGRLAAIHATR